MTENRIDLKRRARTMNEGERIARLEARVEHQAKALEALSITIQGLTESINKLLVQEAKMKGAIGMLLVFGSIAGSLITIIAQWAFRKYMT